MLALYVTFYLHCTRVNHRGPHAKESVTAGEEKNDESQLGSPSELLSRTVRKKRLELVDCDRRAAYNTGCTLSTLSV